MVINRACERVANECSLPKTARPDVVIIQAPLLALELVRRPPDDRQRRFDGIRCMILSVSMPPHRIEVASCSDGRRENMQFTTPNEWKLPQANVRDAVA